MDLDHPLAYTEFGRRPPVVILHGLFGSSRNWQRVAKALSDRFHVLTIDLRNHGSSPWSDHMSYEAMAADVRRIMEDRLSDPPAVIGHSMGGKTAMVLAMTQPDLIDRLVIVDIAPAPSESSHLHLIQAMRAVDLESIERRAEADAWLADEIPETTMRGFLLQNLVPGPDGLRWRLNLPALARNMKTLTGFPEELTERQFRKPTLLVEGEKSTYVRPEHYQLFQRMFPRLQMAIIEGAGHEVHADRPEPLVDRVSAFLDEGLIDDGDTVP